MIGCGFYPTSIAFDIGGQMLHHYFTVWMDIKCEQVWYCKQGHVAGAIDINGNICLKKWKVAKNIQLFFDIIWL